MKKTRKKVSANERLNIKKDFILPIIVTLVALYIWDIYTGCKNDRDKKHNETIVVNEIVYELSIKQKCLVKIYKLAEKNFEESKGDITYGVTEIVGGECLDLTQLETILKNPFISEIRLNKAHNALLSENIYEYYQSIIPIRERISSINSKIRAIKLSDNADSDKFVFRLYFKQLAESSINAHNMGVKLFDLLTKSGYASSSENQDDEINKAALR